MAKSPYVHDVTQANFKSEVIERSKQAAILLDFWATWCGPCRQLGPVLEKLADEYGGAFHVCKVDTEAEQPLFYQLAVQQFGVQSIPFVLAIVDGRPADAFTGALPEPELREFLTRLSIMPRVKAPVAPPAPARDPNSPEAAFEQACRALRQGEVASVPNLLERVPEEHELFTAAERLRAGLEFFALAPHTAGAPAPLLRLQDAAQALRQGRVREALEECLASVDLDRTFGNELARRGMVGIFTLLGEADPLVDEYRRRLAYAMY